MTKKLFQEFIATATKKNQCNPASDSFSTEQIHRKNIDFQLKLEIH